MTNITILITSILLIIVAVDDVRGAFTCERSDGPVLQVLGSGGSIADDDRASAGYLVWLDGRARFLVDTGGGTFGRKPVRWNNMN